MLQSCVVHTKRHKRVNKVVYIKHAPKNHKVIAIKGKRYYYWNGKHHHKTKKGFMVVRVK